MAASESNSKIKAIESGVAEKEAERRWPALVEAGRKEQLTPSQFQELWRNCFADWNLDAEGPIPIWMPSDNDMRNSNLAKWISELGLSDFQSFHQWTANSRSEFWKDAISRIGIKFHQSPEQILDDSHGAKKTAWLPGAKLNISESCFQADENAIAIIAQRPGGPIRKQTYSELRKRANQVANSLVDAGFKVGDSIGIVMPMTDWSVAIYLGIVLAGCNVVSIADSFAPPEIATRLTIAGAAAVFTYDHQERAGKQLPLFRKVAEATEARCIVLSTKGILSVDIRDQDLEWSEFLVDRTDFEPISCTVNETINVLFSSGTTGDPKAIPWSHLTPIKCAVDGFCHQDIQQGDVIAWPTNLGWMMGPWLIFASLINKATIALYEDAPMGKGFGRFVQDAGVTMLGVVPTIVKAWQASGDMESYDWSRIKVFSSTGESSQSETMVFLSTLAGVKPIIEYCGGTEIGGGYVSSVVVLPNFPAAFNTPSVGLDFVLIEQDEEKSESASSADISALSKNSLPVNSEPADQGEVFLIPPSIGLSYRLINRDHTKTYYSDTPTVEGISQLRRHGDHFQRLSSKFCHVYVAGGRADDTMNLGGIKISSAEIERVLNQLDGVTETAAVSSSKSAGPTKLIVFAVVSTEVTTDSLLGPMNKLIRSQLNPLFKIASIKIIDSMPRTASGKVMRRHLRSQLND